MNNQFWQGTIEKALQDLRTNLQGLSQSEASERLSAAHSGEEQPNEFLSGIRLFLSQFKSPLILLLVFAVILSLVLGEYSNSIIILTVLLITGVLGFIQERNAGHAIKQLQKRLHTLVRVKRENTEKDILLEEVVPGDLVILNAGDIIPADALIIESNDLHVNEAALTGEAFPVEKFSGVCMEHEVSKAFNAVFKGTSVVNGTALVLAIHTGKNTELGKITSALKEPATATTFEKGITHFGYLLMRLTLIFTVLILVLNLLLHQSFIESVLFSLALTVGLTPELLPAILTITLASGAKRLAADKVIVKKLDAIQNLGEMDLLCSDKTGTITEGVASLVNHSDISGNVNEKVLLYAYLNASQESGFANPIDECIRNIKGIDITGYNKTDEVPYDFIRKRLSIVVAFGERHIMITKGAVKEVFNVCKSIEIPGGEIQSFDSLQDELKKRYESFSNEGFRVLGVAYKDVTDDPVITKDDENDMIFLGFLVFSDPLKSNISESVKLLQDKGIRLVLITGDSSVVAKHVAGLISLNNSSVITGTDLEQMPVIDLQKKMAGTDVYAEILPTQKEQLVKLFQSMGHSVGFMGDGINDANALKAADVGISIDNAVDVAREAADLVLLDKSLDAIGQGVIEGRKTFQNTLKYIRITTSANFGNMFSMAIASLMLPFFPLLPVQILLNNFLSDLPAIAIASDNVDKESIATPRKWNITYIRNFMIVFGFMSSLFDFITFGLLYYIFKAPVSVFRTAWFMESLLTEVLTLLVIRSELGLFKSKPSGYLLAAVVFIFIASIGIPFFPFADLLGFSPLSLKLYIAILAVVFIYTVAADVSKRIISKQIWIK